jgi:hypothetical protein
VGEEATELGQEELLREYYEVFHAVDEFDKRLITAGCIDTDLPAGRRYFA